MTSRNLRSRQSTPVPFFSSAPLPVPDDDFAIHDGIAGPVQDDQPNDRTHYSTIDGSVKVTYGAQQTSVPVFGAPASSERKLLEVSVTILNELPGVDVSGDGVINTVLGTQAQAQAYVDAQLERANILWAAAGIRINRVGFYNFVNPPNNDNGQNVLADGVIDIPDPLKHAAKSEGIDIAQSLLQVLDGNGQPVVKPNMLELVFAGPLRTANTVSSQCWRPPDDAPEVGPLPAERKGSGGVTFGCLNKLVKVTPEVAALGADPGARAVVAADGPGAGGGGGRW